MIETLDAVRSRPPEPPTQAQRQRPARPGDDLPEVPGEGPAAAVRLGAGAGRRPASLARLAADRGAAGRGRGAGLALVQAEAGRGGAGGGGACWRVVGGTAAVIAVQARANTSSETRTSSWPRPTTGRSSGSTWRLRRSSCSRARSATTWSSRPTSSSRCATSCSGARPTSTASSSELLTAQPDRASREAMANAYFELGELTEKIASKEEALAVHRRALGLRRALLAESPDGPEERVEVADSLEAVGILLTDTGHPVEALAAFEEVNDLLESVHGQGPLQRKVRRGFGGSLLEVGRVQSQSGQRAKALAAFERSRAGLRGPGSRRSRLAPVQNNLALAPSKLGRVEEASRTDRRRPGLV